MVVLAPLRAVYNRQAVIIRSSVAIDCAATKAIACVPSGRRIRRLRQAGPHARAQRKKAFTGNLRMGTACIKKRSRALPHIDISSLFRFFLAR